MTVALLLVVVCVARPPLISLALSGYLLLLAAYVALPLLAPLKRLLPPLPGAYAGPEATGAPTLRAREHGEEGKESEVAPEGELTASGHGEAAAPRSVGPQGAPALIVSPLLGRPRFRDWQRQHGALSLPATLLYAGTWAAAPALPHPPQEASAHGEAAAPRPVGPQGAPALIVSPLLGRPRFRDWQRQHGTLSLPATLLYAAPALAHKAWGAAVRGRTVLLPLSLCAALLLPLWWATRLHDGATHPPQATAMSVKGAALLTVQHTAVPAPALDLAASRFSPAGAGAHPGVYVHVTLTNQTTTAVDYSYAGFRLRGSPSGHTYAPRFDGAILDSQLLEGSIAPGKSTTGDLYFAVTRGDRFFSLSDGSSGSSPGVDLSR